MSAVPHSVSAAMVAAALLAAAAPAASAQRLDRNDVNLGQRNPGKGAASATTRVVSRTSTTTGQFTNLGTGTGLGTACRTTLSARPCLRVLNAGTAPAFQFDTTGLLGGSITVGAGGDGARPFTTNATGVAVGLNADRLDGFDAAALLAEARRGAREEIAAVPPSGDARTLQGRTPADFLAVGGKAADADRLDGQDSTAFLAAGAKAADAEQLDGLDSTAFLRTNRLVGPASAVPLTVGAATPLGSAAGVTVTGTCAAGAVTIGVDTDADDTYASVTEAGATGQVEVDAAAGTVPVRDVDASGGPVTPFSLGIVKADGTALVGTGVVTLGVQGADCRVSLRLLT